MSQKNWNTFRLPLYILMTVISIILMGGAYLFPAGIVHEILGVILFILWAIHIILNRRWYASLAQASKLITSTNANDRRSYGAMFKGRYNGSRIIQTVINCGILICVTSIQNRHAEFDSASTFNSDNRSRIKFGMTVCFTLKTVLRIVFILLSLYGIYAFITQGIWRYLILQQQFFFLDLERGYALFALDYISIIILFATGIYYLNILIQKGKNK